jgi:DNA-binding transcriptional LysR family regulator
MNIEQFEYIVEVAKANSISIASENLHISQSGISQSITNLEEELGVKIFTRSRTGTFPTDEGKKVIKKAYEILIKLQELKEETRQHHALISGELKISVVPNMMMLLFNALLAFRNDHPHVNIEIKEKGTHAILDDVKQHKTDIGFVTIFEDLLINNEHFIFEKLVEGKMKVFVGRNTPLAYSDSITSEELGKYPLVLFKSDHVRKFVKELSKKYGPLKILFTTDSNDVIKKAIIEGLGIGIGPNHIIKYDPSIVNGEIITVDIAGHEEMNEVYFGWIQTKEKPLSPAAKKFLHHLKVELQKGDKGLELIRYSESHTDRTSIG